MFFVEHLFERFAVRAPVVAYFAHEMRVARSIVGRLVVSARPPQVHFRRGRPILEHVGAVIRRTRQVRARGVELEEDAREHFAAHALLCGVDFKGVRIEEPVERLVVFVVARPEGDARVPAQPLDDRARFFFHRLCEGVVLRGRCARERKILPDEYSVFVAEIVEGVGFVYVAAPAAQHVAVEVGSHFERLFEVLRIAAVQGVERRPVRPFYIDFSAVDAELEFPLVAVFEHVRPLQSHGAQTDISGFRVENFPVGGEQANFEGIERAFAVSARPPELGVFYSDSVGREREFVGVHFLRPHRLSPERQFRLGRKFAELPARNRQPDARGADRLVFVRIGGDGHKKYVVDSRGL